MYIVNDRLNIVTVLTDIIYDACNNTGVDGFRYNGSIDEVREEFSGIRFILPEEYLQLSLENGKYWSSNDFRVILQQYIIDQKEFTSLQTSLV